MTGLDGRALVAELIEAAMRTSRKATVINPHCAPYRHYDSRDLAKEVSARMKKIKSGGWLVRKCWVCGKWRVERERWHGHDNQR